MNEEEGWWEGGHSRGRGLLFSMMEHRRAREEEERGGRRLRVGNAIKKILLSIIAKREKETM